MKHEDKKSHQHTGSCCSGSSSAEIESKTCCSSSSEAASTEEPSSCGTKSHEHSHSCCSDAIALTTDKSQHSCCSDHDIVPGDSDIEETAEYRVYGMDCPSCAATIEKSLKTLNDIQHVTLNYNTGKLQVAATSESALSLIPSSVEKLGFNIEAIQSNKKMKTYLIEGMDCAACANTIVNHLKTVPAVKDVRVNFSTGKAQIEHDNEADDIIKEVSKAGYTATLVTSSRQSAESRHHKGQNGPIVFSGIFIALGFIGSHTGIASYMITVLYAIAMIVSGYKPAKSAYYGIKSRSLDMNVLMTVAALGAAVI
ncbi:heavy metal translocating P-type ATPase, partial [Priestia megaterium]